MNQQLEIMDAKPQQVQAVNQPVDMLQYAISQNAPIETIERLVALQEQARQREAKAAFDQAISAAKAEIPVIVKSQAVSYSGTSYKHENLADIAKAVDPILSKYGLSYRFRTSSDAKEATITMFCIISHKNGYSEENSLTAKNDTSGGKNAIQAIGSAQTYLQRYTLKAALGLAAAEDNDARFVEKPDEPLITETQAAYIRRMIEETNSNIENFCKWAKVGSIPEIKAKDYPTIEARLTTKKRDAK